MQLIRKHVDYWRRNLRMISFLLAIWFGITFVATWYAREINEIVLIGPLAFYIGAQGAPLVYVLIIWFYARYMDRLDKQCGVHEADEP